MSTKKKAAKKSAPKKTVSRLPAPPKIAAEKVHAAKSTAKLQIVKPVAGGKTAVAAKPSVPKGSADSRHKLSDADVEALREEFRKGRTDSDGKLIPGARGKGLITLGALAKKWGISTRYASTLVHGQARAKAA